MPPLTAEEALEALISTDPGEGWFDESDFGIPYSKIFGFPDQAANYVMDGLIAIVEAHQVW